MYITTSRKPSDPTRKLARLVANFIGTYENRGKKSIDEVVTRADELGDNRIMMLTERQGNPNSISFISIGKEWDWIGPEIMISFDPSSIPRIGKLGKDVKYSGDKKYSGLFDFHEPYTDDMVELSMDDRQISFNYKKSRFILKIKGIRKPKV